MRRDWLAVAARASGQRTRQITLAWLGTARRLAFRSEMGHLHFPSLTLQPRTREVGRGEGGGRKAKVLEMPRRVGESYVRPARAGGHGGVSDPFQSQP